MRRETKAERAAWSKHFGMEVKEPSKYFNERKGKYASGHEAEVATNLAALEKQGDISDLKEQVRITLVPGNGKIRSIVWVADFVYLDLEGKTHYIDAKGCRTPVYRLKKRLLQLLHNLDIEEV